MDNETPERISQHYKAMLDSVSLINAVIAGTAMQTETDAEKRACVKRNVEHLELMVARDFWTTEDMAPVNAAIASGNAYLA